MTLINCKNAAFAYDGTIVVHGVNFTVDAGEFICILGENGCGKSTIMKGMLHLLKPASGAVEEAAGFNARDIGYLPQTTAAQKDFPASAMEIILSGRLPHMGLRPFYTKKDTAIARDALQKLRIEDLRGVCFRELSGGQQKRVLLARALCAAVRLLALDEPAAGLDKQTGVEMYTLLEELRAGGMAVVMVTHDIEYALSHAQKIIHPHSGGCWSGAIDEYKKTEYIKKWDI